LIEWRVYWIRHLVKGLKRGFVKFSCSRTAGLAH
jgi:hypothetical protein